MHCGGHLAASQWVEEEDRSWDVPDPAACGFEAAEPAEAGGQGDAASHIQARAKDGASPCHQSCLPSQGAPGALLGVVRVRSLPKDEAAAVVAGERKISR